MQMKAIILEENYQMFCYLQLAYKWRQHVPGLGSGKGLFFFDC